MSSPSPTPLLAPEAQTPSPTPTNLPLTRTQKVQAFFVKANDPTSTPYLLGILLDLFCSLVYCVCVTTQLSYAPEQPLWVPGCYAFCVLVYGVSGRRKWNVRREALRERRRREVEGNEAERLWDVEGGEEKVGDAGDASEKREMLEV